MIATIARELRLNERFLIVTHVNPDGDAIGSLNALALVLQQLGKQVLAYCQDEVPGFLQFLPHTADIVHHIPDDASFDVAVALDCGELDRIGAGRSALERSDRIIHIDHHSGGDDFGDLNLVEPGRSSTAELLFEIFQAIPVELTRDAAENIYTAILTDTGSFRFANTTGRALEVAAAMVGLGVAPERIATAVYDDMSPGRLQLLAKCLATLTLKAGGKVAAVWVSQKMLAATGTTLVDTDGFVNYPRGVAGVEMALLFKETGDGIVNVSLRSRGSLDVAAFARRFNGGGHENAAAFRRAGSLDEVVEEILAAAEGYVDGGGG